MCTVDVVRAMFLNIRFSAGQKEILKSYSPVIIWKLLAVLVVLRADEVPYCSDEASYNSKLTKINAFHSAQ